MKKNEPNLHLDANRLVGFNQLTDDRSTHSIGGVLNKVSEVPPVLVSSLGQSAREKIGRSLNKVGEILPE